MPPQPTTPDVCAGFLGAAPPWPQRLVCLTEETTETPAALTDGVAQLAEIVAAVARGEKLPRLREGDLRAATCKPTFE